MATPTFNVGGLASGLDTNTIVDKLTALETQPLDRLKAQQAAYQAQVSILGNLASKLSDFQAAAQALASSGVLGTKASSVNTAFAAVPGSAAAAGDYDIRVTQLAGPARFRSAAFAAGDTVTGGTLTLTVAGTDYAVPVSDGSSPADLAFAIRKSGAPVSALLLTDDQGTHLGLTTNNTGYAGADPAAALQVSYQATGTQGRAPGFTQTQAARNATFTIDSLPFTRSTNSVTDALPGTALTLKVSGGPSETLTIANDPDGTKAKLQSFVDAYNAVATLTQGQLAVTKDTDRSSTLAGDGTIRLLQGALQALGSTTVGASTVRSLADLGVRTQRDGSLSIDYTTMAAAIGRDPAAANTIFSDAAGGIAKRVSRLVDAYTAPGTGLLVSRQDGLRQLVRQMSTQEDQLQLRITAYHDGLLAQFAAMENLVSSMKNVGSFLNQQSTSSTK